MNYKQIRTVHVPGLDSEAPIIFDSGRRLDEDADEYKIACLVSVLVAEGRKLGVKGDLIISSNEAYEFGRGIEEDAKSRLPNGGFGMDPKVALPIVEKVIDEHIREFWERRLKHLVVIDGGV